jgi:thiol-disulfide isomerase/thioredoxin
MRIFGKLCFLAVFGVPALSAQNVSKLGEDSPVKASTNVDPAAEKLRAESEAAFRNARDLTFELTVQENLDQKKAKMVIVQQPDAKDEANEAFFPNIYRVAVLGENGEKMKEWASDGKTAWMVNHAEKKVLSLELDPEMPPPMELMQFFPPGLWFPVTGLPTISSKLEGESEVDGLKCRVMKQVQETALPKSDGKVSGSIVVTTVRHIGPDLLPRKIEISIKSPPGMIMIAANSANDKPGQKKPPNTESEIKMVSILEGLKLNTGLKPGDLVTKTPPGYTAEKGTRTAMGYPSAERPKLNAEVGKPAIAFSLKTPDGKEVTLESLKGRIVVLDFWATWCGPCKLAMPALQKLHERYAGKPVSIIGVNCMEPDSAEAVKYMEKEKFTYMQLLGGDDLVTAYGISGIPTLIVIDAQGNVLGSEVGFSPDLEKKLSAEIDKALGAKPAPEPAETR